MAYRIAFAFAVGMMLVAPVQAQEQGQIGITMGYPASIGAMIHLTDRIAVRPDFRFTTLSDDSVLSETSSDSFGVGIGALFYLTKTDALRTYGAARFGYNRTTSESTLTLLNSVSSPIGSLLPPGYQIPLPERTIVSTTSAAKSVSGTFGAQYAVHRRFSVFGEVGVGYGWSDIVDRDVSLDRLGILTPFDTSGPRTWSSQTAAGVILYFKD
jgi:hypothetical protein